ARRLRDGARLAPDELRPARAEPQVAAEGQFARRAVEFAVAPLHRVNAPPVADRAPADGNEPEERREVVGEAQISAEPGVLRFEFRDGLVLEEGRHATPEDRGQKTEIRGQKT